MTTLFRIVLVLLMSCVCAHADTIRDALVNLCDPAKIEPLTFVLNGRLFEVPFLVGAVSSPDLVTRAGTSIVLPSAAAFSPTEVSI